MSRRGCGRRLLLRHPWLGPVPTTRPLLGPNLLRGLEHALAAAALLISDIADAAAAVGLVRGYVRGAVMRELAEGEFPLVSRMIASADRSADEQFSYGLRRILAGIADSRQAAR